MPRNRSKKAKNVDERRQSSKGDGWCRILTYYHPKFYAFCMILAACVQALAFPSLGFIVAKVQMILITSAYNENWVEEKN